MIKKHADANYREPSPEVVKAVEEKLSPCIIHYAQFHEYMWVSGSKAPPLLTLAIYLSEWLA
jgi:hypothetical protein